MSFDTAHTRCDLSPEWQDDLLRAIEQVEDILHWDSPDSVSKVHGDGLKGKQYDVILYYMPPFVKFDDKEGVSDPVRLRAMLQACMTAVACCESTRGPPHPSDAVAFSWRRATKFVFSCVVS